MKTNSVAAAVTVAMAASVAGCASAPTPPNSELLSARDAYQSASANPTVGRDAADELRRAETTLQQAEQAQKENRDSSEVTHLAYLARQRTLFASLIGTRHDLEREIGQAAAERDQITLEARTREAEMARQQALNAGERADKLQDELQGLQTKASQRGTVVTLGGVVFDTGKARLQEGGRRSVDRLASVLKDHPDRKVLVEGYTDSTGDADQNRTLSEQRASAVKDALVAQGVESERIVTRGYGQDYPVATNASAEGRQMNRRVEVVFSDTNGNLPSR